MNPRLLLVALLFAVLGACRSNDNLREARVEPRSPVVVPGASPNRAAAEEEEGRSFAPVIRSAGKGPDFLGWTVAADKIVARIGNEELHKSQVFDALLESMPEETRGTIAILLANRVLAAECERHGIKVPEDEVTAWYRAQDTVLRRRAEAEFGAGADFERFMLARFGQRPDQYERAAKDRERARRLLARLIRYQEVLEDRVELRIISVTDRELALRLREQIDRGAEFSVLAEQYSVHPSAEAGGLMVPVWRGTLNDELDRVAFDLQVGATSQILQARDQTGRDRYQIIKLIRRLPGRAVAYSEVESEIVTGIADRSLDQDEWYMWQLRLERSGQIKLFDI